MHLPINLLICTLPDDTCSSYIYFDEEMRASLINLPIYVGSVPTEHLATFDTKLKNSLVRIVQEGIDMKRMAAVIDREQRQVRVHPLA